MEGITKIEMKKIIGILLVIAPFGFILLGFWFLYKLLKKSKAMEKATSKEIDYSFVKRFETGTGKPILTIFRNKIDDNVEGGYGHVFGPYAKVGHLVGTTITSDQAEQFFKSDIKKAQNIYMPYLDWEKLTETQIQAVTSHAYNTGKRSETIVKSLNAGEIAQLRKWWKTHYISSKGNVISGLVIRRAFESELL